MVSPDDLDLIARTVIGESAGEPERGQAGVAHVIRNRLEKGAYGGDIPSILFAPKQFEPWSTRRSELMAIRKDDPKYVAAYELSRRVFSGDDEDPTNGALNFANVKTVEGRGNTSAMRWINDMKANGSSVVIGRHTFGTPSSTPGATPAVGVTPVTYGDQTAPRVNPTVSTAIQEEERFKKREETAQSWGSPSEVYREGWRSVKAAIDNEWILNSLIGDSPAGRAAIPNPDFRWTPEAFKAATKDIPRQYWASLSEAHSEEHAKWLSERIQEKMDNDRRLDEMGWSGSLLRLTAGILDPTALALAIGTEGIAAGVLVPAKAGLLARVAGRGTAGALAGVATIGAKDAADLEEHDASSYYLAMGAGLALSGTIGAIQRTMPDELSQRLIDAGRRLQDAAEASIPDNPTSTGGGLGIASERPDFFVSKEALERLQDGDIPRSALNGKWRLDAAAVVDRSESPIARSLGAALFQDGVGKEGHALNGTAAETVGRLIYTQAQVKLGQAVESIYAEWAREQGLGWLQKKTAWSGFIDEVGRYVRSPSSFDEVNPHVEKLAKAYRKFYAERLELLHNPFEGRFPDARPVAGSENVTKNDNYMPRAYDPRKLRGLVEEFGEAELVRLFQGAIRSAQPDLDPEVLERMAQGHVRNRLKDAYGIGEDPRFAYLGRDESIIRQVLRDDFGLSQDDIEHVVSKLPKKTPSEQGGIEANFKRRIDMDEGFAADLRDRYGRGRRVALSDVLDNDIASLTTHYNRRTAGRVAMAQVRIMDSDGNLIVNGITKDSEFEEIVRSYRQQKGIIGENPGRSSDPVEESLRWGYDMILGRTPADSFGAVSGNETFRKWSQRLRAFNYVRLMGNMGFNQAQEIATPFAQLGMSAMFKQMPILRRIRNMDGATVRAHGLERELEAIIGAGAGDILRANNYRWDEFAGHVRASGSATDHRIDNVLRVGGDVVSTVSGFNFVNQVTQMWAARAAAQKFADLAERAGSENLKRMAAIGLDKATLDRVVGQIKKHASMEDGVIFKQKVKLLNVDRWDDLDARVAFEQSLFRWSRQLIQENDYGTMSRFMSDPLVQVVTQFKSFVINAFAKQFLHNVHMRDPEAFATAMYGMLAGGLMYTVQTNLKAIGKSDSERYRERELSPEKIAWAGFARTGWASILPDLMGVPVRAVGFKLPNVRSSGSPTDVFFGNPTVGLFDDGVLALEALSQAARGHHRLSQQDVQKGARVAPLGNYIPTIILLNQLGAELPRFTPKER